MLAKVPDRIGIFRPLPEGGLFSFHRFVFLFSFSFSFFLLRFDKSSQDTCLMYYHKAPNHTTLGGAANFCLQKFLTGLVYFCLFLIGNSTDKIKQFSPWHFRGKKLKYRGSEHSKYANCLPQKSSNWIPLGICLPVALRAHEGQFYRLLVCPCLHILVSFEIPGYFG